VKVVKVAADLNSPTTATKREGSHRAALPFLQKNPKIFAQLKITSYLCNVKNHTRGTMQQPR